MKRDFNSIISNTDDRGESSWFVLLFFKSAYSGFRKYHVDEIKFQKLGVYAVRSKTVRAPIYQEVLSFINGIQEVRL